MTSLKGFLPPAGSALWRKDRGRLSSESESSSPTIKHVVIREVWQRSYPSPHAIYKIDVMTKSNHWFVFRRYREFDELHKKLVSLYGIPKDMLPPKKFTSKMALCHLEKRKAALEHYLQRLVNSSTYVSSSPEILEFLEVQRHDVMSVTKALAKDLFLKGEDVLAKGESYTLTPTQLYCITRQLQLPEPANPVDDAEAADLGNLYDFIYQLQSLCVSSVGSKAVTSQELSSHLVFDISLFKSLSCLIIDGCPLTLINNLSKVQAQINNLTARHCLTTMKELLADCAAEKRMAPKVKGPVESWRGLTTARFMQNRVVVQPWRLLTHLVVTHNKLAAFDTSLKLLPVLQNLDMSHNEFVHLDLQQLCCPTLQYLNLSHNNIHFITGMPGGLSHLKALLLSHNNLETVAGLNCLTGLIELNITSNQIHSIHEISKLCLMTQLKYLSVAGNPFARVKPYRIALLSHFKGRELVLDKRPITKKERVKLRSYPTKIRASTSPDHMLDDDVASEDVLPVRSHSFNLFGPAESDDDSGIEGASSLRSSSMVIDPDCEISGRELLFNWSYYIEEDALSGSDIACLQHEASKEEQTEGFTSNLHALESGADNGNVSTCLHVDHDSIKNAVTIKDESKMVDSSSILEVAHHRFAIPSSDANIPAVLSGHKGQPVLNCTGGLANGCPSQPVFSSTSESAEDRTSGTLVVTDACQQFGETSPHDDWQPALDESTVCNDQINYECNDIIEQPQKEWLKVYSGGTDVDTLPNCVESLVINNQDKEGSSIGE